MNTPAAFNQRNDGNFLRATTALMFSGALAGLAAHVGFVNLNSTFQQFGQRTSGHCMTDAMRHVPSRTIRTNTELTLQLQGR